jgi:hypothetical protein
VIDAISTYDVSIAIKPLKAADFVRLLGEVHAGSVSRPN